MVTGGTALGKIKVSRQAKNAVTIVICCYNAKIHLKECVNSLTSQTISSSNYKILFINDASTDNSLEIAKSYAPFFKVIKFIDNKKNTGLVNCCNQALGFIDTPYFTRLDPDDYFSCDALERISQELNRLKGVDFLIFNRWDLRNNIAKKIKIQDDIYSWISCGTIFNTEAVRSVGGYSQEHWEEFDLYIKLLEAGFKYRVSPYFIYYYRRTCTSMTSNNKRNKEGFESLLGKWGSHTLDKHGHSKRILEYYGKV